MADQQTLPTPRRRSAETDLSREGMTRHDINMLAAMQDAIADEAAREKPTLGEMLLWVDTMEARERNALHAASCVNGYVPDTYVRSCAIARALFQFMMWADMYREDVETLYRAKQHMERRRG